MAELLALQLEFAAALRDADSTARTGRWIAGDPAHVERRVAIYRNNMVAAADKALAAAYPVLRQVVGAEFFHGLAHAYQRATPSTSGDLTDFGAQFPAFLAAFEHAQSLPYLGDLARLEWAVHRADGAADAPDWDPAALLAVDAQRQAEIRFVWTAGHALVESTYPIVRIWTIHQPGYAGEFVVDWDLAQTALVARSGFVVTVAAAARGEAAFLAAAWSGAPLGDAAAAALQADPGTDLGALLARAITSQLICGLTLP